MANQQRIVQFSGMVQGVGFRYAACRVAGGFEVTGTVRNLADGRVECIVEGDDKQIDGFVEALADHMSEYIRGRTERQATWSGRYNSFGVCHGPGGGGR